MIDALSDLPTRAVPLSRPHRALSSAQPPDPVPAPVPDPLHELMLSDVALTMSMIAFILGMAALGMSVYTFIRLSSLSRRVQRIVNRQERARQEAQAREKGQDGARPGTASAAPRASASGAPASNASVTDAPPSRASGASVGASVTDAPASRASGASADGASASRSSSSPRPIPPVSSRQDELKSSLQEIFRPEAPIALQTTHLHLPRIELPGAAPLPEAGDQQEGQGFASQGSASQGPASQGSAPQGVSVTDPWSDRPQIGALGSGQAEPAERHRRAQEALSRMPWPAPRSARQDRVIHASSGRSRPLEDGLELEVQSWLSRIQQGAHGRVGLVMGLVYARGEELADSLSDIGERAEWRQVLIDDMLPRLERFMRVQSGAEPVDEWIGLDLLPMIDDLVRLMSRLAADGRGGRLMAERAAVTLTGLLYGDLHDACAREGWFGLMPVVPLATRFDPRMHQAVGQIPLPGLSGMVVEIRKVGLLTPDGEHVRAPAQVIIVR